MSGEDDFLKAFSSTLADVAGLQDLPAAAAEAPAPTPATGGKLVYMGFDDATRTVIRQNLGDHMTMVEVGDLPSLKQLIVAGEVALLVFDGTSFIKPGIAITRLIKERGLPVRVAHIYGVQRVTEDYEKYRQYHVHLQPDYRAVTDEIFMLVDQIRKDFGF